MATDRGGLLTTLTKSEYEAARNGSTPTVRSCARCGKPLTPKQRRACSRECGRALGAHHDRHGATAARKGKPKKRKTSPAPASAPAPVPSGLEYFEQVPPEVLALETAGWRHERRV